MTPERLALIRKVVTAWGFLKNGYAGELLTALTTEQSRLDCLAAMPPGARLDALSDPRGLRAALDERIAARERGQVK